MRMLIHLRELLPNSESLMAALYFVAARQNGRKRSRGYKRNRAKRTEHSTAMHVDKHAQKDETKRTVLI